MKTVIIAAVAWNRVIGKKTGEMPWHSKEEFQHFKNTTMGFPIIMGRKTFESLDKKPLKGRLNIVISRNEDLSYPFEEVKVFNSVESALEFCKDNNHEKVFITGGGYIFEETIDQVDEMILSFMKMYAAGDVYFPAIDYSKWDVLSSENRSEFQIVKFRRKDIE